MPTLRQRIAHLLGSSTNHDILTPPRRMRSTQCELETLEPRLLFSANMLGHTDLSSPVGSLFYDSIREASGPLADAASWSVDFLQNSYLGGIAGNQLPEISGEAFTSVFFGGKAGLSVGLGGFESDLLAARSGFAIQQSFSPTGEETIKFSRAMSFTADLEFLGIGVGDGALEAEQYLRVSEDSLGVISYHYGASFSAGWSAGWNIEIGAEVPIGPVAVSLFTSAGVEAGTDYVINIERETTEAQLLSTTGQSSLGLAIADTFFPISGGGYDWVRELGLDLLGGQFGLGGEMIVDATLDTESPLYNIAHGSGEITASLLRSVGASAEMAIGAEAGLSAATLVDLEGGLIMAVGYGAAITSPLIQLTGSSFSQLMPSTDPQDDYGDDRTHATSFPHTNVSQLGAFHEPGDEDWLRVSVRPFESYTYTTLPGTGLSTAPTFELYQIGSATPFLSSSASGANQVATFSPDIAGDIVMRITNNSQSVGEYGIEFTATRLPLVGIVASSPLAVEGGPDGVFRVTSDTVGNNLNVYYLVSGSANPSNDYIPLDGVVLVPGLVGSSDVTVAALEDNILEGDETVEVLIAESSQYIRNPFTSSASVVIQDQQSTQSGNLSIAFPSSHPHNGTPFAITATLVDDNAAPISGAEVTFTRSALTTGAWTDAAGNPIPLPNNGLTDINGQSIQYYRPGELGPMTFTVNAGGESETIVVNAVAPSDIDITIQPTSAGGTNRFALDVFFSSQSSGVGLDGGTARLTTSLGGFVTDSGLQSTYDVPINHRGYADPDPLLELPGSGSATITVTYLEGNVTHSETIPFTVGAGAVVDSHYDLPDSNNMLLLDRGNSRIAGLMQGVGLGIWDPYSLERTVFLDRNDPSLDSDLDNWSFSRTLSFSDNESRVVTSESGDLTVFGTNPLWPSANIDTPVPDPDVSADFNPSGTQFVTSGDDSTNEVRIRNLSAGTVRVLYSSSDGELGAVDWSPDGSLIAFVGFADDSGIPNSELFIYNASTGALVRRTQLGEELNNGGSLAWSPDSQMIAVQGEDEVIWLMDRNGNPVSGGHRLVLQDDASNEIEWSPDGQYLAILRRGDGVEIWSVANRQRVATLQGVSGGNDRASLLAWRDDSAVLFATSQSNTVPARIYAPFDLSNPGISWSSSDVSGGQTALSDVSIDVIATDATGLHPDSLAYSIDGGNTWIQAPLTFAPTGGGPNGDWNTTINQSLVLGINTIELRVTDLAGNQSFEQITIERVSSPMLAVYFGATPLTDSQASPIDLGLTTQGQVGTELLLTVFNTGGQPLTLLPASMIGSGVEVTQQPAASVAPAASTVIGVRLTGDAEGVVNATLSLGHDGGGDGDFNLSFVGQVDPAVATNPEIDLRGLTVSIVDGDTTPDAADGTFFGSVDVDAASPVLRTFTIHNTGSAALGLTGSPIVQLSGSSAFSISSQPGSMTVAPGGSVSFEIAFDPAAIGPHSASVTIENDDADEDPYTFVISGEGTTVSQTGMVAHYTFENTLADVSGNGVNGTGSGNVTYGAGVTGQAVYLDGASHVSLGDAFDDPGDLSAAFWFRPDSSGPDVYQRLFTKHVDGSGLS
ncbi:MAG: choice-of-anchor D domain-containing protein, partial [Planctomycetota bacterium]